VAGIAARDQDGRAAHCKFARDGNTDTGAAARDDRHLAFDTKHVFHREASC